MLRWEADIIKYSAEYLYFSVQSLMWPNRNKNHSSVIFANTQSHSLYSLQLYSLTLISNPFFITSLLAVRFERKSNLFFFFISNPINQRSDSSTTAVLLQTRLLGTQYASACVTFTDLFSCSSVISTTLGTGSSLFSFGTWNSQSEYIKSCWKMFVIKANGCKKRQDISF